MCRSLSAGLSERPDQGTGRTGIRRLSPHAESSPVPMSVGLLSPPGKSLPYPSFPDTRSCSQRPPGHLPFCGVQPVFLILCSSHTETIPKEETWSFQAVALYKNAMYATTFKKKKVHKKGSFYFRNRQISGCYCWKPDYSLNKREVMVVIEVKMYFSMKSWLLQQCMSDSLCLSSCYVVNISASNESQTWIQTQLLSLFANNRRVTRATLAV